MKRDIGCFKENELLFLLILRQGRYNFKVFEFLKVMELLKVGMFFIIILILIWGLRNEQERKG